MGRRSAAQELQVPAFQMRLFDDATDEAQADVQSTEGPQTEAELLMGQETEPETQPETEASVPAPQTMPSGAATDGTSAGKAAVTNGSTGGPDTPPLADSNPDQRDVLQALAHALAAGAISAARRSLA